MQVSSTSLFGRFAAGSSTCSNVLILQAILALSLNAGCGSGGDQTSASNLGATNVDARLPILSQNPNDDSPEASADTRPRPSGTNSGTTPSPPEPNERILRGEQLITGGRFVTETDNYTLTVAVSEPFAVVDAEHIEANYQLRSTLSFER